MDPCNNFPSPLWSFDDVIISCNLSKYLYKQNRHVLAAVMVGANWQWTREPPLNVVSRQDRLNLDVWFLWIQTSKFTTSWNHGNTVPVSATQRVVGPKSCCCTCTQHFDEGDLPQQRVWLRTEREGVGSMCRKFEANRALFKGAEMTCFHGHTGITGQHLINDAFWRPERGFRKNSLW